MKPADLQPLFRASADASATEELKRALAVAREKRNGFFLDPALFDQIVRWKLGGQYGRAAHLLQKVTPQNLKLVTQSAFSVRHDDADEETRLRLKLLMALSGVGIGVASAILALAIPEKYCVIDYRGWSAAFAEKKTSFEIGDYLKYQKAVAELAAKLGWSVQDTDLAMWEWDRRRAGPA